MPDLSELLAAEARRQEPTSQPPFEDLIRARRGRDRRGRIAAGSLLVAVVAGVALVPTLVAAQRPPTISVVVGPGSAATVTGVLRSSGGPMGAGQSGLLGVIVFESATGQTTTTKTGSDGTFTTAIKPGTYTVTGTSPQYGDEKATCRATDPVTVSRTGLAGVAVICPMRTAAAPPAGSLTARLTLPTTTIRTGESVAAQIILTNNTGQEIHVVGCGPIYSVLLTGNSYTPGPSWLDCAQPITIPKGDTTYPVTLAATVSECSPRGDQGMASCLPNGSMPGLPPGRYAATTWGVAHQVPVPAPIKVTVKP